MTLNDGKLGTERKVKSACSYEVLFDYSKLPVNVIGTDTVLVELNRAVLLPKKEPEEVRLRMQ